MPNKVNCVCVCVCGCYNRVSKTIILMTSSQELESRLLLPQKKSEEGHMDLPLGSIKQRDRNAGCGSLCTGRLTGIGPKDSWIPGTALPPTGHHRHHSSPPKCNQPSPHCYLPLFFPWGCCLRTTAANAPFPLNF